jgi:hypothetical protein
VINAEKLYYLTGSDGENDQGLGPELLSRGYTLLGREICGVFAQLKFQDQIEVAQLL